MPNLFSGADLCECHESSPSPSATTFPKTATHIVDFGLGGLSGIGSLTAWNMEGHGIRTIIIGEKGKGASELHSVASVSYEAWWNKTFAPHLIKTA
jgi:hypothetical protein